MTRQQEYYRRHQRILAERQSPALARQHVAGHAAPSEDKPECSAVDDRWARNLGDGCKWQQPYGLSKEEW